MIAYSLHNQSFRVEYNHFYGLLLRLGGLSMSLSSWQLAKIIMRWSFPIVSFLFLLLIHLYEMSWDHIWYYNPFQTYGWLRWASSWQPRIMSSSSKLIIIFHSTLMMLWHIIRRHHNRNWWSIVLIRMTSIVILLASVGMASKMVQKCNALTTSNKRQPSVEQDLLVAGISEITVWTTKMHHQYSLK